MNKEIIEKNNTIMLQTVLINLLKKFSNRLTSLYFNLQTG